MCGKSTQTQKSSLPFPKIKLIWIQTSWTPLRSNTAMIDEGVWHAIDAQVSLYKACKKGNVEQVRSLLLQNDGTTNTTTTATTNPDPKNDYYKAPLHLAVEGGYESIVDLLLKTNQVNPNRKDPNGDTPLHLAACHGYGSIFRILISTIQEWKRKKKGKETDNNNTTSQPTTPDLGGEDEDGPFSLRNKKGQTPLHVAAGKGHVNIVRMLIEEVRVQDPFLKDEEGDTPFMVAAYHGNESIVRYYLEEMTNQVDIEETCNHGNTALHGAIFGRGNLAVVQLLMEVGHANPNSIGQQSHTPLHRAAKEGHIEITKYLLEFISPNGEKVNVNVKNDRGDTPLIAASHKGHKDIVQLLLQMGEIDVNVAGQYDDTALHCATRKGHTEIVQILLETNQVNPNMRTDKGDTPLILATYKDHKDIVQLLLLQAEGIEIDLKGELGYTALHWAARNGDTETVKFLLQHGTTTTTTTTSTGRQLDCNATTDVGDTPLILSAEKKHKDIVRFLIQQVEGVDPSIVGDRDYTALHWAAKNGDTETARLLLDTGRVDCNARIEKGDTPLIFAVNKGHKAIVQLLLQVDGIDPNAAGEKGYTALHCAARHGHSETVKLLLQTDRVDCNARTDVGDIPLILASYNGHKDIVGFLLQVTELEPDAVGDYSSNSLHCAAKKGHTEIVELLLGSINSWNDKDESGDTPLHIAVTKGFVAIVRLLLEIQGIETDATNCKKKVPLQIAVEANNVPMTEVILESGKANCNVKNADGDTLLHSAIQGRKNEILRLLVNANGMNLNATDDEGRTPIQVAAINGNFSALELLLQAKNNKRGDHNEGSWDDVDDDMNMIFQLTLEHGNLETARSLLQATGIRTGSETHNNFNRWESLKDKMVATGFNIETVKDITKKLAKSFYEDFYEEPLESNQNRPIQSEELTSSTCEDKAFYEEPLESNQNRSIQSEGLTLTTCDVVPRKATVKAWTGKAHPRVFPVNKLPSKWCDIENELSVLLTPVRDGAVASTWKDTIVDEGPVKICRAISVRSARRAYDSFREGCSLKLHVLENVPAKEVCGVSYSWLLGKGPRIEISFDDEDMHAQCPCNYQTYIPNVERNIYMQMQERTFSSLISCAEALKLDYLWIDCICIEQEDPFDVITEVKKMKAYYGDFGAVYSDVLGGFNQDELRNQILDDTPITSKADGTFELWCNTLGIDTEQFTPTVAYERSSIWREAVNNGILSPYWTRAWTYQELLMPDKVFASADVSSYTRLFNEIDRSTRKIETLNAAYNMHRIRMDGNQDVCVRESTSSLYIFALRAYAWDDCIDRIELVRDRLLMRNYAHGNVKDYLFLPWARRKVLENIFVRSKCFDTSDRAIAILGPHAGDMRKLSDGITSKEDLCDRLFMYVAPAFFSNHHMWCNWSTGKPCLSFPGCLYGYDGLSSTDPLLDLESDLSQDPRVLCWEHITESVEAIVLLQKLQPPPEDFVLVEDFGKCPYKNNGLQRWTGILGIALINRSQSRVIRSYFRPFLEEEDWKFISTMKYSFSDPTPEYRETTDVFDWKRISPRKTG